MSTNDFRSDLEMWCDMWDDAQKQEVHPKQEPLRQSKAPISDSAQDDYFDYLDTEELFQEEKTINPIFPDSAGPDSETTPPRWVNEDLLKEIESLKNKLFKVENKLAEMGGGKKWVEKPVKSDDKKLMSEISSLRKRIEKVSSQLGIKDEPSPWKV